MKIEGNHNLNVGKDLIIKEDFTRGVRMMEVIEDKNLSLNLGRNVTSVKRWGILGMTIQRGGRTIRDMIDVVNFNGDFIKMLFAVDRCTLDAL